MNEKQSVVTFVLERVEATFVKSTPWSHCATKLSVVTFMNEKQSVVTFVVERVVAMFVKKITLWPHSATKIVYGHIGERKIFRTHFRERNKFP